MKVCQKNPIKWPEYIHYAFFADRVIISQSTDFSPYFLWYGAELALPLNLAKATFLVEGFKSGMSTPDLLDLCIKQL